MNKSAFVVGALSGWLLVGAVVAAPQFVQGPSARYGACMAYDSHRGVTVLFGGIAGVQVGDTWEWDGASWTQVATSGPLQRSASAMVYDSARGVCVLFGGETPNALLGDTWEWDGATWTYRTPFNNPTARDYHAMCYDVARGVCVLHGGFDGATALSETWEYDGLDWTHVTSAGPGRENPGIAFDSVRQRTVLFGGTNSSSILTNDTWEWDGASWVQVATTGPAPRHLHAMAYLPSTDKVVLFGGRAGGNSAQNDTWLWDGASWAQASPSFAPTARLWVNDQMVFDAGRSECVLFGGTPAGPGAFDDTWTFDGTQWHPKLEYVTSPVNGHRYALTPPMTWVDAEALAVLEGGHLATVRNSNEDSWITQQFAGGRVFIGFNDAAVEGQWVWASGASSQYTNWVGGGPDNYGNGQHYATIDGSGSGLWDDICPYGGCHWPAVIELPVLTPSSATTYGTGCGIPALDFSPTSNPIIGATASALVANAPTHFAGVTFGISDTLVNGLPILPYSLAGVGMPGCYLLQSNEVFGLPVTPVTASTLQFDAAIPLNSALLTQQFYIQAYAFAPGANAAQVVTSNGIAWTIGNQ